MTQEHVEQQRAMYGAPLADLMRSIMVSLDLNQAQLAGNLGLSTPMLSQLMSAQRVKIGNPVVVERLRAMLDLSARAGSMTPEERLGEMTRIRNESRTVTDTSTGRPDATLTRLRIVATPDELRYAADRVSDIPALAELLRAAADGPGADG